MRIWLTGVALVVLSSAGGGCLLQSDDSDDSSWILPGNGLQLGDSTCGTLVRCSIADAACQQAILRLTACIRGDATPPLPPIRTLTREQLREELQAESTSEPDPAMFEEDSALKNATMEAGLVALHLLKPQASIAQVVIDDLADSLLAFYRLESKDVTVVSDTTADALDAMNSLAHEFTHYLQDLDGQLSILQETHADSDHHISAKALMEGEATLNSIRTLIAMLGHRVSDVSWDLVFGEIELNVEEATNASDSPLFSAFNALPYTLSPRYIERAWERFGRPGVDELFDHRPASALDWLGVYEGPATASRVEPLDCDPPLAPDGFRILLWDTVGISGVYALLATQNDATLAAASSWRNDKLAFYVAEDPEQADPPKVLAVWRIRFESEASADGFAQAIAPLGLSVTRFGHELAISVSSDARLAPIAPDALLACPTAQEFEASRPTSMPMPSGLRFRPVHFRF